MGIFRGPGVVNDGLVFGYDTGYPISDKATASRFYPGEPTFNWIDHQNAVAQDSYTAWTGPNSGNWVANHPHAITAVNSLGNSITGYYNGGVGDATNTHHAHWVYDEILKKPVVQMRDLDAQWKAKSFNVGKTPTQMGLGHGGSYTISWLQWSDTVGKGADVGLYQSGFHDGRSYSTTTQTTAYEWERKSFSVSSHHTNYNLGSNVSIYMYGHTTPPNTSGIVKIADVQLEIKPHATPFADDTRSNTASLIDLKRTASIDVSDVSFNSNAQPTFDGTNDYIPFTSVTLGNGDWSVEFIANAHGSSYSLMSNTSGGPVANAFGVYANKMHYRNYPGSAGWQNHNSSTTVNYNQVYHLTYVNRVGNTMDMYINGVKDSSSGFTSTTSNGGPVNAIGRSWNGYFDGDIHVCRRYTNALSDSEVAQNYNAYKNRFNI